MYYIMFYILWIYFKYGLYNKYFYIRMTKLFSKFETVPIDTCTTDIYGYYTLLGPFQYISPVKYLECVDEIIGWAEYLAVRQGTLK